MRKNKVLKYLKKDGIEKELECLTKEGFTASELEFLSKYYHLQLQAGVNTVMYVVAIIAALFSGVGMILTVLTDLPIISGWIGSIRNIGIWLVLILPCILALCTLCYTIKANTENVKWKNKITAIELLLALNTENNENIENIEDKKE